MTIKTILALGFLFLFSACGLAGSHSTGITATPTLPPSTITPTATETVRPSLTATATPLAIQPSQTPVSTDTPAPRPTLDPALLPLPALPDLTGNASDYVLARPDPQIFLNLTGAAYEQKKIYSENITGSVIEQNIWNDIYAFVTLNNSEFSRLYPQALPDPRLVLQSPYPRWWTDSHFVLPMPPRFIATALIDQLNQDGISLESQREVNYSEFHLQAYSAELDGTPGPEWVVMVTTPRADYRYNGLGLWQALDELPDHRYRALGTPIIAEAYFWPDTFAVRDLTGDGISDLIVMGQGNGFSMTRTNFTIYQWVGNEFKLMTNFTHWQDMGSAEDGSGPQFALIDGPSPALQLRVDINRSWKCVYKEVYTFRWPNGIPQQIKTTTMDSQSPACLLGEVSPIYKISNQSISEIHSLLERAIAGFDPLNPNDHPALANAHYEMAMVEAILGNDRQTRFHLNQMAQDLADDPMTAHYLAESLPAIFAHPKINAMDLCSLGFPAPNEVFNAWWQGLKYPGFVAVRETICSPSTILKLSLQRLPIIQGESPESLLQAFGLQVQSVQAVHLPGLAQTFWLALVNIPDGQTLIGMVPTEDGIHWKEMSKFYQANGKAIWLNRDINGDGAAELAVAIPVQGQGGCSANQPAYEVWIAGRFLAGQNHYTSADIFVCQQISSGSDLERLLSDVNGDGLSDRLVQEVFNRRSNQSIEMPVWPAVGTVWYSGNEISDKFQTIIKAEDQLLTALSNGADPDATRSRLLALRKKLTKNPLGRNYTQQIDYLIALSYELQGQNERAVQGYFDLARGSQHTLWSNLAAVKLQHK